MKKYIIAIILLFICIITIITFKMNKKERSLALRTALTEKNLNKELIIVDSLELNSLKTPEFRLQIEYDINSYRNHIIRDLRQQVPTISEAELAYIIYSQAGFPLPIIEQFLEVNQRKLYYYRDCIKKKIAKANAPDMDRFLRELL